MTEAIYLEATEKAEAAHKAKRRVSVSGMLKILGVSRSGYRAWLKHVPSNAEKRRESVKAKIKDIYDKSKQNYGAPKITQVLRKTGETISERTVGQYMKQMGIKAQWVMLGVSYNEKWSNVHCIILCYMSSQHSSQINTYDTCQNTKYDI